MADGFLAPIKKNDFEDYCKRLDFTLLDSDVEGMLITVVSGNKEYPFFAHQFADNRKTNHVNHYLVAMHQLTSALYNYYRERAKEGSINVEQYNSIKLLSENMYHVLEAHHLRPKEKPIEEIKEEQKEKKDGV